MSIIIPCLHWAFINVYLFMEILRGVFPFLFIYLLFIFIYLFKKCNLKLNKSIQCPTTLVQ